MDRLHGYSLAETYTYGIYPETFPARLRLLSLMAGHRPPDCDQDLTVIEFGCGQGMNLCMQAALHPQGRFIGLDISSDHVAHASELAAAAGLTNVQVLQADLLELAAGSTLPPALAAVWGRCRIALAHGVLGWVSPQVGQALQMLAAAALAPGGLFFLSYNTLPGWLPELPYQHAALALARRSGGSIAGIDQARRLFEQLAASEARLFQSQPDLAPRLALQAGKTSGYLLHEYGHAGWQPLYADQVIEACAAQGLSFLGSVDLPALFPGLLPESHQALILQQPDVAMQQLVRDLLINASFRRDVYVRGRMPLWPGEAERTLARIRLRSALTPDEVEGPEPLRFDLDSGTLRLPVENLRPLLRRLQQGPASLAELIAIQKPAVGLPQLQLLVALLIHSRKASLLEPPRDPAPVRRLNGLLLERMAAGAPYSELLSPLLGAPIQIEQLGMLTLQAMAGSRSQDPSDPSVIDALVPAIARAGIRFTDADADPGAQRAALLDWLAAFAREGLPVLRELGVIAAEPPPVA